MAMMPWMRSRAAYGSATVSLNQPTRLWGVTPVSYPCINGGSYDQIVSEIYPSVIRTGLPHYDHVYAAMTSKDSAVKWIPYQRVILPKLFAEGQRGVTVVSEVCPVDINVV